MSKLYTHPISITVEPFNGFRNKWRAKSGYVARPYSDWGTGEWVTAYAKTPADAVERLKDKLCKITAREERNHVKALERDAGTKEASFSRDQDCNSVVPRPKLFEDHP